MSSCERRELRRWALCLLCCSVACGGKAERGAAVVRGQIVGDNGLPFAPANVVFDGAVVVADSEGRFELHDVPESYDLTIATISSKVWSYQGLRSRSPILRVPVSRSSPDQHSARVTFALPEAPSEEQLVSFPFAIEGNAEWLTTAYYGESEDNEYSFGIIWRGARQVAFRAHALLMQTDPASGLPTGYSGHHEFSTELVSAENQTFSIVWSPLQFETREVHVSARLPEGYRVWGVHIGVRLGDQARPTTLFYPGTSDADFSIPIPEFGSALYDVQVLASGMGSNTTRTHERLRLEDFPIDLDLEPGPSVSEQAPPPLEVGSTLSWQGGPDRAAAFVNLVDASNRGFDYRISTDRHYVTIPDLSPLGRAFPSAADYGWAVFMTTADSLDELARYGTGVPGISESTYAYSGYAEVRTR